METQVSRADLYKCKTQRNDLKQHADKIIQGIKKIGPNHAKRAIWELFQNAVDLSVYNGGHWARVYGDCGPVISGIIGPGSSGFITEVIGPAQGMNSAA